LGKLTHFSESAEEKGIRRTDEIIIKIKNRRGWDCYKQSARRSRTLNERSAEEEKIGSKQETAILFISPGKGNGQASRKEGGCLPKEG